MSKKTKKKHSAHKNQPQNRPEAAPRKKTSGSSKPLGLRIAILFVIFAMLVGFILIPLIR
ncbi:MAG: hypothetical protein MJ071_01665 [Oscillospiraceae bacterium]|nr:hypothetical protein [Oscillospiraceae bacterium]